MNDHDRSIGPGHEPATAAPQPAGAPGNGSPRPAPATHSGLSAAAPRTAADQAGPVDVDRVASLVYDRLAEKIGHRLDVAGEMPSVEEAVALRERAPELYDLWLRIAQDRAATGNYVQRAPYEVPERLAQGGRPRALSALVVVLAFCGYLAWLGGPGPYIAGLIAIVDLVAMVSLFFGLRPGHLSDTSHPASRDPARKLLARATPLSPRIMI